MKIAKIESLHADAGQRNFDFLKITTDDGLVGWSEYNESFGGLGVSAVIDRLAPALIGKDPRAYEALVDRCSTRCAGRPRGGVVQQAIGAIENALLDIKAKALGIPVYELLGGPVRDRIRLYWSHCGTYRLAWAEGDAAPAAAHAGRHRRRRARRSSRSGYTALKTNVFLLGERAAPALARLRARGAELPRAERRAPRARRDPRPARGVPRGRRPGRRHPGRPELQLQDRGLPQGGARDGAVRPLLGRDRHARRQGAALHPRAHARSRSPRASACSAGATTGPFFEQQAVDVAIIDTPVERRGGVAEDRRHGRRLRGQRRAAQLLRPPGDA